jgi:hypothetical protein
MVFSMARIQRWRPKRRADPGSVGLNKRMASSAYPWHEPRLAFPGILASTNGGANVAISESGRDPSTKRHIALEGSRVVNGDRRLQSNQT